MEDPIKNTTKPEKSVFVVRSENLMGAAIESLLSQQAGFHLQSAELNTSEDLIKAIQVYRPDVIVMDENTLRLHGEELLNRLQDYPRIRVLIHNPDNNHLQVLDKQLITITNPDDFFKMV